MSTKKKATSSAKSAAATLRGETPNLPAVMATGKLALPEGFKAKRVLSLPSLVMKIPGEQRVLVFLSGLQVSTVKPKPKEAPATVADVADLVTGEQFKFLVPAVVESTLCDTYGPRMERPARDDLEARQAQYDAVEVLHKAFAIRNAGKREGKRHVDFEVVEVEAPTVTPAA